MHCHVFLTHSVDSFMRQLPAAFIHPITGYEHWHIIYSWWLVIKFDTARGNKRGLVAVPVVNVERV